MRLFDIVAILVSLSAVFSYINYRFLKLPTAIGLMLIALAMSLVLIALGSLAVGVDEEVELLLKSVDFDETLLHGMLSFLLFAGALHVNFSDRLFDAARGGQLPGRGSDHPGGDDGRLCPWLSICTCRRPSPSW